MRVFTVPASAPFLRTVAAALIDGSLIGGFDIRANPERLADATIYLPTQRAGRMAREIFLEVLGTGAAILPRMIALGDVDEDGLELSDPPLSGPAVLDIPPALDDLERRLALAQLINRWAARLKPDDQAAVPLVAGGPASALALAGDLARLIDDMTTRGVDWSALDTLVPVELDQFWQLTLEFLKIAKDAWPAHLQELGKIDPAARRDLLISAEAARLQSSVRGPVIAAGSTGSIPATARLLHVIAGLPNGAVVLPGLDTRLDEKAWLSIGGTRAGDETQPVSSHPQFALHALLTRLGVSRKDVVTIGTPAPNARDVLTSEVMRPAEATSQWHRVLGEPDVARKISEGLQNLAVIEAANTEAESLAVAVTMREAHEHNKSAAFVTPDRALARRVSAALGRWNLDFEDSAGISLMETQAGLFARLAAVMIADDYAPAPLLALLKHPLMRLGGPKDHFKQPIADLELTLLRGTRPAPGPAGLARDFATFRAELAKFQRKEASALHASEPRVGISHQRLEAVDALIKTLARATAPLDNIRKAADFSVLAKAHRDVLLTLSADETGEPSCFGGADGRALANAFDGLLGKNELSGLMVAIRDYPDMFQTAFADRIVRDPPRPDTRLRIYGLLEARLIECDRVILGGLTEGVWPPQPRTDPWLNRPMRHQLGLNLPERRIGLSAHDFAQLLGHRDVILSHASKSGGAPAVASRFLHRLEAVADETGWKAIKAAGNNYIRYADALDRPDEVEPASQPIPRPALALRPLRMSVTEIENWLRDPYSIYAKHILKLTPLDPVDMPLTAADRGSAIHDALGDFTARFPHQMPPDAVAQLRQIGALHFAPLMERPEARALWWPRFQRIVAWFAAWEAKRRAESLRIDAETRGEIKIPLDNGRAFTLSTRADRIEHRHGGTYAILDYKTGTPPSHKQVSLGLSPQLTLEAAILRGGGFQSIPANGTVSQLAYVRLSGNRPAGKEIVVKLEKNDTAQTPDDAATEARQKLETLIRAFENEQQEYASLVLSMWSDHYGPYDDLARIKEWSASLGGEDIE